MAPARGHLRFGPFELHEPLGGGMDIVYRARHDGAAADVALKVLRHERRLDGSARARFTRELQAMARLSHPNICPLLEAGEVDGLPFLCMPLLGGEPLARHIEVARIGGASGPAPLPGRSPGWAGVVELAVRIADALHAAHSHGIVHRDLKPSNLLVVDGEPVLLDFGLACDTAERYRRLTRTGQLVGTPTYMAPEQLDSRLGPIDARTDVYGLGAVLYEALTLEPPFAAACREELFARILAGPPPDPRHRVRGLPDGLVVVLDTALQRRAHHRYRDAAALRDDLLRLLRGDPIRARRPSWPRRCGRWARERPLQAVLAGVLLAAVGLLATALANIARAATDAAAYGASADRSEWVGRLSRARAAYDELPPPWPWHRTMFHDWLREHGEVVLAAPAAAETAAPGLRAWAEAAVAEARDRLAWAETVEARSIDAWRDRWAAAKAAAAADRRYADLVLETLPGLVPLGCDPRSGLLEFYDLASGEAAAGVPGRGADGRLSLTEQSGMVLVLLPGGSYRPSGHDQVVTLGPFLIGKHELTRAQQARLDRGRDPSEWPLGTLCAGELQTPRHPVVSVHFFDELALLRRWGFDLPTEVQWEYAATVGGTAMAATTSGNCGGRDDGFLEAAPVGSFEANGFGLCDVIGNVAEYRADAFDSGDLPARAGDGLRAAGAGVLQRVAHGGHFGHSPVTATYRGQCWADQPRESEGVRVVRRLERGP